MKKLNFKGKVQYVPTLTDKLCRCTLQVGKSKIVILNIARVGTKSIEVALVVFNGLPNYYINEFGGPGRGYQIVNRTRILSTAKNAKTIENNIYTDIKAELVKYLSTIIVGMGTNEPKKEVVKKKKKEPNADGFKFLVVGEN
jgi:hypothetical protein